VYYRTVPHVDVGGVVCAAQQDVWRSVPQRPDYLYPKLNQNLFKELTKICQFELPSIIDQQVLGFQVSMENFPLVTVGQTS
ncbi:hypothetical protein GOODEAATRI_031952, partial [Goodea atripinnis]